MKCAHCQADIPEGNRSCTRCGWQAAADAERCSRLNRVFSGRYEFQRLLGAGGFAEVFLARDVLLERDVAVKILLPQHAQDPQTVERFLREARLYAKLEHPNIIPIYDTGVLQGHVFITMKYIRGLSLKQSLAAGDRFDSPRLAAIAAGVARALAYIHRQGIIHRDIKPANIIVEGAAVYLADFGIARAESSQTLTQTGMIVGTPHYLSPEQIQGKRIDARSDIYALGATLYELASGRPPFCGDSPLEILYQHINESARPLKDLAPGIEPTLERVISRCIAKDPARRFQNADGIADLLDRAERGRSAALERTALTEATAMRRGKRLPLALAAVGLLASLAGVAYYLWLRPGPAAVATRPSGADSRRAAGSTASAATGKEISAEQAAAAPSQAPGDSGGELLPPAERQQEPEPVADLKPGPGQSGPQSPAGKGNPARVNPENAARPAGAASVPERARSDGASAPAVVAPSPGTVRFSSFPPLADVIYKGERIGNTEQVFEKELPAGEHVFTFTIPGYQSAQVPLTVEPGKLAKAHHRFPPFRQFTVTARPFGRIDIDGRDYGDTPQTIKLAYGEHLVRVTKQGYRAGEKRIVIDQESKNTLFFELEKEGDT